MAIGWPEGEPKANARGESKAGRPDPRERRPYLLTNSDPFTGVRHERSRARGPPKIVTWVRLRRGSLRNGYHIQGRQQARKLPNPDTGRASLVPAAAVIPAPIAYIKVVAVKKLVVEPWAWLAGPPHRVYWSGRAFPSGEPHALHWACWGTRTFTLKKLETAVMINRDSRGHQYSSVRGEILGLLED
ncbi:hypothetical protein L1887_55477 [Cichorium endivia]|nr:hypothetical protein L1887_55474 [Cichorium endivia]KAI3481896.1 hypothetical protein L1887_55477 [Cichorium endivia]